MSEEGFENGGSQWVKRLQGFLRESGISFEAEGEAVRISLGMISIEVAEASENSYAVVVTVPLPGSSEDARDEETVNAYRNALRVLAGLGSEELRYELDTDIPGYPALRIIVEYSDPNKLAESLIDALKPFTQQRGMN